MAEKDMGLLAMGGKLMMPPALMKKLQSVKGQEEILTECLPDDFLEEVSTVKEKYAKSAISQQGIPEGTFVVRPNDYHKDYHRYSQIIKNDSTLSALRARSTRMLIEMFVQGTSKAYKPDNEKYAPTLNVCQDGTITTSDAGLTDLYNTVGISISPYYNDMLFNTDWSSVLKPSTPFNFAKNVLSLAERWGSPEVVSRYEGRSLGVIASLAEYLWSTSDSTFEILYKGFIDSFIAMSKNRGLWVSKKELEYNNLKRLKDQKPNEPFIAGSDLIKPISYKDIWSAVAEGAASYSILGFFGTKTDKSGRQVFDDLVAEQYTASEIVYAFLKLVAADKKLMKWGSMSIAQLVLLSNMCIRMPLRAGEYKEGTKSPRESKTVVMDTTKTYKFEDGILHASEEFALQHNFKMYLPEKFIFEEDDLKFRQILGMSRLEAIAASTLRKVTFGGETERDPMQDALKVWAFDLLLKKSNDAFEELKLLRGKVAEMEKDLSEESGGRKMARSFEYQLEKVNAVREEMESVLEMSLKEIERLRELAPPDESCNDESVAQEVIQDVITDLEFCKTVGLGINVLCIGGHVSWAVQMAERFPCIKFVPEGDTASPEALKSADVVFFQWAYTSHTTAERISRYFDRSKELVYLKAKGIKSCSEGFCSWWSQRVSG